MVGVETVTLMSQNFSDLKRLHVMKNQALFLKQLKRDQIKNTVEIKQRSILRSLVISI